MDKRLFGSGGNASGLHPRTGLAAGRRRWRSLGPESTAVAPSENRSALSSFIPAETLLKVMIHTQLTASSFNQDTGIIHYQLVNGSLGGFPAPTCRVLSAFQRLTFGRSFWSAAVSSSWTDAFLWGGCRILIILIVFALSAIQQNLFWNLTV